MENKIVAGPFLDHIIAKFFYLPELRYSTNAKDALLLLNQSMQCSNCDLNISLRKTPNTQVFKIDLNGHHAEDGYFPTAVCLAHLGGIFSQLKGHNYNDLKEKYDRSLKIDYGEYDWNEEDANEVYLLEQFSSDFHDYFTRLTEEEFKALIDYANK